MPNPKDLTGQIYKLKEKGAFLEGTTPNATRLQTPVTPLPRPMKRDYFVYLIYTLFLLAAVAQFSLIFWMDLF